MNDLMNGFVLRVGGKAGWGIASAADIFAGVCLKLGYHVFASKDYASQIREGHNYHTVRVSKEPVNADAEKVDLLLALDAETLNRHGGKVVSSGIILVDDKINLENKKKNLSYIIIPLTKIEEKLNEKNIRNAVFLGATIKCLGVEFGILLEVLENFFKNKPALKEKLIKAAQAGYDSTEKLKEFSSYKANPKINFLSGNEAIVEGALKAKLSFHAQYPMTPVSAILHRLAKEATENQDLTIIQPEDEIAAVNMALGASYAGSRAMTATSGGGFSLMVEGLSLAGMAGVPLVLIEGQRPGPATGLPTKTEQGDLKFVLNAGHGDFPKVVVAPGDVEECYTETKRAFYLAEKYQLPVIILVDKHLAESFKTTDLESEENNFVFDYEKKINIIDKVDSSDINRDGLFKRYQGNSLKRTIPGTEKGIFTCAGDEHDEVGEITENPEIREQMVQRRMSKLKLIEEELPAPELISPEVADLTVVSWGSNKGAILEAVDKLNAEGKKINFLSVRYMLPFQKEKIKDILTKTKKTVLVENNYSAQLGGLIREQTGMEIKDKILRYDGKTFTVDDIYNELKSQ